MDEIIVAALVIGMFQTLAFLFLVRSRNNRIVEVYNLSGGYVGKAVWKDLQLKELFTTTYYSSDPYGSPRAHVSYEALHFYIKDGRFFKLEDGWRINILKETTKENVVSHIKCNIHGGKSISWANSILTKIGEPLITLVKDI